LDTGLFFAHLARQVKQRRQRDDKPDVTGAASIAALGFFLLADVVVLKNGNEIQGEIIQEAEDRIVIRFPGGTLELPRKQVESVRRQARKDYLIDEGEKQVRRGNAEEGLQMLEEALREDPGSQRAGKALLDAREHVAGSLRDQSRFDEARAAFASLLAENPAHPHARAEIEAIDRMLAEADREEERGRSEIGAGDLETGTWRLQRLFDGFPERRSRVAQPLAAALLRHGDRRLHAKAWKEALGLYQRALTIDPDLHPRLRVQHTVATARAIEELLPAGDFKAIARLSAEGLEVEPESGPLRFYHALALEGLGKAREAAEMYLSITEGKRPPLLEKAVARLREEAEAKLTGEDVVAAARASREVLPGDYREALTPHFRVRHKNNHVARDVARVSETVYAEIFKDLGCVTHLRNPILITIYPTQEEYVEQGGFASWSGGGHRLARRRGDLSDHRIYCYQGQTRLTTAVIPHEVAHALFIHRLNYPQGVPLWANEGFAVLREPPHFQKYLRRILAEELSRKKIIPLRELLAQTDYPQDQVELYYAESFSLVEFLVELESLNTFVQFVKAIAVPRPDLDAALKSHFDLWGRQALENRWLARIRSP
jgi:tetratricopeptide (TPR) repeat protein